MGKILHGKYFICFFRIIPRCLGLASKDIVAIGPINRMKINFAFLFMANFHNNLHNKVSLFELIRNQCKLRMVIQKCALSNDHLE